MVFKEVEIKNPLYIAELDNGVTLYVYDGYAEGSDKNSYQPVENIGEDDYEFVGWEIIE